MDNDRPIFAACKRFIIVSFLRANRFMERLLTRYKSSSNRQVKTPNRQVVWGAGDLSYQPKAVFQIRHRFSLRIIGGTAHGIFMC